MEEMKEAVAIISLHLECKPACIHDLSFIKFFCLEQLAMKVSEMLTFEFLYHFKVRIHKGSKITLRCSCDRRRMRAN